MSLDELIAVARGDGPADVVLTNGKVVNTFIGRIETADVVIHGDKIAAVGQGYGGKQVIDLQGRYVVPGLINGHTHLESSLLHVPEYAKAVVPHGTSTLVTDLHEIANVCGLMGMRALMRYRGQVPLDLHFMVPSCVPATHLETAGAVLGAKEVAEALSWEGVIGLGEMMNFPGVFTGQQEVLDKIRAAEGRVMDGHAPGLRGKNLQAYLAAGIMSDHECTTLDEAWEKLKLGMHLFIREGSSEKNLDALLPLVNDHTYRRCCFVVDDRSCVDLLHEGDIDAVLRKAIQRGLEPVRAIQMATINPAEYFRLSGVGGIGPGYWANLLVVGEPSSFDIHMVFHHGKLVAQGGQPLFEARPLADDALLDTVHVKPFSVEAFALRSASDIFPVIEAIPGQIITRKVMEKVKKRDGLVMADPERDLLKMVVVERHRATGNIGVGLVKGFGLQRGAIGTSIAHDSHNIVAVGEADSDIYAVLQAIIRMQGGLAVVAEGKELASLPLPIAGLLSPQPLPMVVAGLSRLEHLTQELGGKLPAPFALLSFLALPVIPELRLTDLGIVDVTQFRLITP